MDPHSDIIEIKSESSIKESLDREVIKIHIARWKKEKRESEAESESDDELPEVTIFKVPETITTKKPEAYKPQQIGFGPHHGPETTRMEQRKRYVVDKIQQHYNINDFKLAVVDNVAKIVPDIREHYEMLLQGDDASLARDFAVDGLFLLNLFQGYESPSRSDRLLAQDILMVENQIPYMVLKTIDKALRPYMDQPNSGDIYRSFIEIHSPLELSPPYAPPYHVDHLLDYMYHAILYNDGRDSAKASMAAPSFILFDLVLFLGKLPVEAIVQLYEQMVTSLQKFSKTNYALASASKLPCITLNDDSEVILVEYEATHSRWSKNTAASVKPLYELVKEHSRKRLQKRQPPV